MASSGDGTVERGNRKKPHLAYFHQNGMLPGCPAARVLFALMSSKVSTEPHNFVKSVHCVRDTGRAVSRHIHWRSICMSSVSVCPMSQHFISGAPRFFFFHLCADADRLGGTLKGGRDGWTNKAGPQIGLSGLPDATRLWLRVKCERERA